MDSNEHHETAILVHVNFLNTVCYEELNEFKQLAASAGASEAACVIVSQRKPDPKFLIGTGKAAEIKTLIDSNPVDLVIVNYPLSPAQERNLSRFFGCRVLDRIGLVLDIFAQRARTYEGKLQVELAQLKHLLTRLIRGWTHLERQKGGIGLRGPGETQLETDRRLVRARIASLEKRLAKVRLQRQQNRRARHKAEMPTVALVGYTNAGKSSLFNALTGADSLVEDKLFATLDPTLRRVNIAGFGQVILADTVGFIRQLPHDLVDAFRATLEETQLADLLLHVVDASDEARWVHNEQVVNILQEIAADNVPRLLVYNKVDKLEQCRANVERDEQGKIYRVWVSAEQQSGLIELKQAIAEILSKEMLHKSLSLLPNEGKLRARLYQLGCVLDERLDSEGKTVLSIRLSRSEYERLMGMRQHEKN